MPQMMPLMGMSNGLMPQGAGAPQVRPRGPQAGPEMIASMEQQHAQSRAQLNKLEEVAARQRAVREQMNHLKTLGDLVSEEDVVSAASKIVAAGVPPMEIATILADMPSGAEALKEWIVGQEAQFAQKEAQLGAMMGMIRHNTGLAALRLLAAESFGNMLPPGVPPQANPLTPEGPGLGVPAPAAPTLAPDAAPNMLTGGEE